MEYSGKLYGKIGARYVPLEPTTADFEALENNIKQLKQKLQIAMLGLNDIKNWDEDLEDEYEDPGERANNCLRQLNVDSIAQTDDTDKYVYAVFDCGVQGCKDEGLMAIFDDEKKCQDAVGEDMVIIEKIKLNNYEK